ncbi:MAG: DUF2497 domain-containing protein [Gluconobacter albidus]|uniref:DUF2497 domain-containing protein n=1 Tax=Gluconobacter sp. DsW_056 TaxID=1511209 RepID=UPI001E4558AD|nr:DUF2497 domain-containing protein [Gluconobacter sp. DsW_056]
MTTSDLNQHEHHDGEDMTDVLSSIRRILHDDPAPAATTEETQSMPHQAEELTLDSSMMVAPPAPSAATISTPEAAPSTGDGTTAPSAETEQSRNDLMNAQTVAAAERSLDELHAAFSGTTPLASDTVISRGSGLTIEDMVRSEVRSMVRTWLDAHLPSLVEILVRAEIARLRPRE